MDTRPEGCQAPPSRFRPPDTRFERHWPWSANKIGRDFGGIELTLLNRTEDTGQHFLSVCAALGSVAATDFVSVDSQAPGLFDVPVGRVDRRVEVRCVVGSLAVDAWRG
jgi:hypothetical protein